MRKFIEMLIISVKALNIEIAKQKNAYEVKKREEKYKIF